MCAMRLGFTGGKDAGNDTSACCVRGGEHRPEGHDFQCNGRFVAKLVLSCMGASGDDVLESRDDPSNWSGMLSLKGRGVALAGTWAGGVDELEAAEVTPPCSVA